MKARTQRKDAQYESFLRKLGAHIRSLRKARGLTQEDMITYGFERRWYQRIENGDNPMTLHTVYRLSKVLKVKPAEVLGDAT